MKKQSMALLLGVSIFLLTGCGGPGNYVAPSVEAILDEGTTDWLTEDEIITDSGTEGYITVKAAADEPVAGAQDIYYWGYINTKGEWVIAPQYTEVFPFVDNVATVKTESGEWQLINKDNEVIAKFEKDIQVIQPLHPRIYPLPEKTTGSGSTIIDGMIVIGRDVNGDTIIGSDDLYGYADTTGKIVIEPQYAGANAFGDGLAAVYFDSSAKNTWGYIDKTGSIVIEPKLTYAGVFSEGLARAQILDENNQITGLIDKQGNFVLTADSYIYPNGDFKDGTAPARLRHEFGIIDKSGNVVATVPGSKDQHLATNYSPIGADSFQEGLYPVFDISLPNTEDGFWPQGFIDTAGNFAVPAQTEWKVSQGFSDGMCCVFKGDGYFSMDKTFGYIDKTGNIVIPIKYYKANMFNFGYAAVATGDMAQQHFTIIDKTGKTVAELKNVTNALPFTK